MTCIVVAIHAYPLHRVMFNTHSRVTKRKFFSANLWKNHKNATYFMEEIAIFSWTQFINRGGKEQSIGQRKNLRIRIEKYF